MAGKERRQPAPLQAAGLRAHFLRYALIRVEPAYPHSTPRTRAVGGKDVTANNLDSAVDVRMQLVLRRRLDRRPEQLLGGCGGQRPSPWET